MTPNTTVQVTAGRHAGKKGILEFLGKQISYVRFFDAKNYEIQADFVETEHIQEVSESQEGGAK